VIVTFLGTGTSTGVPVPTCACAVCRSEDPRDKRLRPSVLLAWDGATVLIDTATDLRRQALDHGLTRIDAVLYTHAHADHVFGLDELRLFNWRQGQAMPVYGSAVTLAAIRRTFWYVFEDVEAGGGKPITGWRVGGFAYLTDVSAIPKSSYPLLAGLDLLVLSALRIRPHPTHMHLARALEEVAKIGARRTLLTHIAHEIAHAEVEATLPDGVHIAYDGLVAEVP
jgi:phosphoribosyl 1,2-cyclic phosphate phosphodiesterase